MDSRKILDAAAENYRRCSSYEDQGVMRQTGKKPELNITANFSTTYVRPGLLIFQITADQRKNIVVQADGESVRSISTTQDNMTKTAAYASLEEAMKTLAGVTYNIAQYTLSLIGEFEGIPLTKMHSLKRVADETIDEADCFTLEGSIDEDGYRSASIWISQEQYALRRLQISYSPSEEFLEGLIAQANLLAAMEGDSQIPQITADDMRFTNLIDFHRVTFNNSITIDSIISAAV